jgi:glutathione S-transferase
LSALPFVAIVELHAPKGGIMPRLYDNLGSGNGFKCRLLLAQLGIAYERVEMDIRRGATRTPEYLAKNANGRIPLYELDDGRRLAESNAILWWLAEGTPFLPADRFARAEALQWMFFEQYSHEPYVAVVRNWVLHCELDEARRAGIAERRPKGYGALAVMEGHLQSRLFFVGERYSIADIALYAYTHVAPEGGFDLAPCPSVRRWLDAVRAMPGYIPITQG